MFGPQLQSEPVINADVWKSFLLNNGLLTHLTNEQTKELAVRVAQTVYRESRVHYTNRQREKESMDQTCFCGMRMCVNEEVSSF